MGTDINYAVFLLEGEVGKDRIREECRQLIRWMHNEFDTDIQIYMAGFVEPEELPLQFEKLRQMQQDMSCLLYTSEIFVAVSDGRFLAAGQVTFLPKGLNLEVFKYVLSNPKLDIACLLYTSSCRGEIFCAAGLPVPMREMRISASLFHVSKPERVSGAFLSRYRTMLKDRNRTHRFS